MYRLESSRARGSSICSILSMPSVVMLSTWVSPRWNRPDPCGRGTMPTSAGISRMSLGPRSLAGNRDDFSQLRTGGAFHPLEQLVAKVLDRRPFANRNLNLVGEFLLQIDGLGDVGLRLLETTGHRRIIAGRAAIGDQPQAVRGGTGLHHHDVDLALVLSPARPHQFQHRVLEFLEGRVDDPVAVPQF